MASESRSVLDSIKKDIANSGNGGFKKFFSLKGNGEKGRVRFLTDLDDAIPVVFHNEFKKYNHPCLEQYDEVCPNCDGKTVTQYAWPIWDYEAKEQKWFMYKSNKASPIPALLSVFEVLGDITSADVVITKNGEGTGTTYGAVPTKPKKFNVDFKVWGKKRLMKDVKETFNDYGDNVDDDDADDDEITAKRSKGKADTKSKKPEYDDDDDEDGSEYEEYTIAELEEEIEDRDEEIPTKLKKLKKSSKRKYKQALIELLEELDDDDDDVPFDEDDDEDDDDEDDLPPPKRRKQK